MNTYDKEHYELMKAFDKDYRYRDCEREDKQWWTKNQIYKNGETNNLFLAYRSGFNLGRFVERSEGNF